MLSPGLLPFSCCCTMLPACLPCRLCHATASPIAVDLARRMLLQLPGTYALVVSTENITQNMYKGTQRSMLIPNVLFRVGAAAMLLTNKASEAG